MSRAPADRSLWRCVLLRFPVATDRCLFCGRVLGLSIPRTRESQDPGWYDDTCFQFAPALRSAGIVIPTALLRMPLAAAWEAALNMEVDS